MALGKNEGQKYEDMIFESLKRFGFLYPGTSQMGMAGGVDAIFCHHNMPYNLEIKNELKVDYGQKKLSWNKEKGWSFSIDDDITRLYVKHVKVLEFIQKKKIIPRRYTKPLHEITCQDGKADQKAFEDRIPINIAALWRYYSEKEVHYIQIGRGYGFYHLDKDIAELGTPQFNCDLFLRLRAKYHDHYDRSSGFAKPTPWNYSFFAVLKVKSKPKRSEFNLEEGRGQRLPPIKP